MKKHGGEHPHRDEPCQRCAHAAQELRKLSGELMAWSSRLRILSDRIDPSRQLARDRKAKEARAKKRKELALRRIRPRAPIAHSPDPRVDSRVTAALAKDGLTLDAAAVMPIRELREIPYIGHHSVAAILETNPERHFGEELRRYHAEMGIAGWE